ncbi:unnamed protein product [Caenorhabditis bovis]|uniref:F-box domain-containing protein n=1 Tax=Caenorhabditis bovis TaxID=2654633 RepID=A0A8S1EI39_9PELO|nr:unnamed protein product [Caenorhabditis bovis]
MNQYRDEFFRYMVEDMNNFDVDDSDQDEEESDAPKFPKFAELPLSLVAEIMEKCCVKTRNRLSMCNKKLNELEPTVQHRIDVAGIEELFVISEDFYNVFFTNGDDNSTFNFGDPKSIMDPNYSVPVRPADADVKFYEDPYELFHHFVRRANYEISYLKLFLKPDTPIFDKIPMANFQNCIKLEVTCCNVLHVKQLMESINPKQVNLVFMQETLTELDVDTLDACLKDRENVSVLFWGSRVSYEISKRVHVEHLTFNSTRFFSDSFVEFLRDWVNGEIPVKLRQVQIKTSHLSIPLILRSISGFVTPIEDLNSLGLGVSDRYFLVGRVFSVSGKHDRKNAILIFNRHQIVFQMPL